MDFAYKYRSKTARGRVVAGIAYASSKALAIGQLRRGGLAPFEINMDLPKTLVGLVKTGFSTRDLARFYATIGRRIKKDKPLVEGLSNAADFVQDSRLRQAIQVMRLAIMDGRGEGDAMAIAGFSPRDSKIVAASATAGRVGDAFVSLSREATREGQLKSGLWAIFTMPMFLMALIYAGFYAALVLAAPNTIAFLKQADVSISKMSEFHQNYFAFAVWFNDNLLLNSIGFWLAPAAGIFLVAKLNVLSWLADKFRWLREISIKTDAAMLWSSYALLYDANISPREICKLLQPTAVREDSRLAMRKMQLMLNNGVSQEEAVSRAGFQPFVVEAVKSSLSAGDLAQGLRELCDSLEEDILVITQILKDAMKVVSLIVLGIGVGALFMVSYFPLVSAVLQNL